MNRESLTKLQLDRRLVRRKGWISKKELDAAEKALPDVGSKATTLGEVIDESGSGDETPSQADA